jgi:1-acyl-sn-glycerol-3-phosphate acyltransferase
MSAPATPVHIRVYRIARVVAHLMRGQRVVRRRFPGLDTTEQDGEIERWSRQLLSLLAIDVRVHETAQERPRQCMIVANHVSWLDIFVIHAQRPGVFVAKSDIRDWPLIGSLVDGVGTLFISRGSRTHARRTNERIVQTLASGRTVAVFPEGSTSAGDRLAHFHAALLQPAIDAEAALLPVGIRYRTPDDAHTDAANYIDDMSFVESLWRVVSQPRLTAELHITAPLSTQDANRRALARASESAIARALDLPLPHSRTETPDDPPDAPPSTDRPRRSRYPDPTDQDA